MPEMDLRRRILAVTDLVNDLLTSEQATRVTDLIEELRRLREPKHPAPAIIRITTTTGSVQLLHPDHLMQAFGHGRNWTLILRDGRSLNFEDSGLTIEAFEAIWDAALGGSKRSAA